MKSCLVTLALTLAVLTAFAPWHSTQAGSGSVSVLYAGSLVNLNEKVIGPAFAQRTGYVYQGQGLGSVAITNEIKGRLQTPDVVELVDPATNRMLMGKSNGDYVSWYITYARTQLVIGYDPAGRFAHLFDRVRRHALPWYRAVTTPGLRLGRSDPALDPKGYYTLFMFRLAQRLYHLKNFARRVLGSPRNPAQIFPEEVLVARLLAGEMDAGVFYLNEVKDLGIPYITLPPQINFGEPKYKRLYSTEHYTDAQGKRISGRPILFTITIPSTVKNKGGAMAFVKFTLGRRARLLAREHGLLSTPITLGGDRKAVPPGVLVMVRPRSFRTA